MDALDVNNNKRVSDYDGMEIEINAIDQSDNEINDPITCDESLVIVLTKIDF